MLVAFDFETFPIGVGAIAPKPVCLSAYPILVPEDPPSSILIGNDDPLGLKLSFEALLDDQEIKLTSNNAKFDMGVAATAWPDLLPKIFKAYEDERIYCTIIREKLLNLSTHGSLKKLKLPGGSNLPLLYSLGDLIKFYFGEDRSADKKDADSWRTHFQELDGIPATEYPPEAANYAKQDAIDHHRLFHAQERRREEEKGSFETQELRVAADFALFLKTCVGIAIDETRRQEMVEELAKEYAPEKLNLLIEHGVLRPAQPPRPYIKNPEKMTQGKPESIDTKKLQALIKDICEEHDREVLRTPTNRISTEDEFLQSLVGLSPILDQYHHRAHFQKLVTTELPRIAFPIVHPTYDILKATGRTASKKSDLFPAINIQNVDPRVRECFVPRPGNVLLSSDYNSIELVSCGQKTYTLFGESRLRDLINSGIDPHAYLGSQLAYHLDGRFRETCDQKAASDPHDVFSIFWACKLSKEPELRKFFEHFRTFAKPTGLGFPGGLGPDTFVTYAKASFGVTVDRETAVRLREIWHQTFPEMKKYFQWVNNYCTDPRNPGDYMYLSPFGMVRAGCTFCAAANGAALQTPTAEGAILAVVNVVRACFDSTMNSILFSACKPLAFVHDEIIAEIPEDDLMTARADELTRLMVEPMQLVLPDVKVSAEPALMRRWNKGAKEIRTPEGKLEVWTPNA